MSRNSSDTTAEVGVFVLLASIGIASISAWLTHLVWIIQALASGEGATTGQMVLGFLGAFMPPVGVVHGVMIWMGAGG